MSAVENSERHASRLFGRRQFVVGGLVGAAGLFAGAGESGAAIDATGWLSYQSSGPDGASVRFPSAWVLDSSTTKDLSLDPFLLYPHQSFALRTTPVKPPIDVSADGDGLPDLSGYPTDAAIIWLMYYDAIVEGPPYSGLSFNALRQLEPDVDGFRFYSAKFSNSVRSFLLWVRIGTGAPRTTVAAMDACLRSIRVP